MPNICRRSKGKRDVLFWLLGHMGGGEGERERKREKLEGRGVRGWVLVTL